MKLWEVEVEEEEEEDDVVVGLRRGCCWWGEVGLSTDCVQRRKKPHEKRGRGGACGFGFWFAFIIAHCREIVVVDF